MAGIITATTPRIYKRVIGDHGQGDAEKFEVVSKDLSLPTTRTRHVGDDPNMERYDPDLWTDEFAFLNQPGQADIQSDLFYDYRTNLDAYPQVAGLDAPEGTAPAGALG